MTALYVHASPWMGKLGLLGDRGFVLVPLKSIVLKIIQTSASCIKMNLFSSLADLLQLPLALSFNLNDSFFFFWLFVFFFFLAWTG